MAGKLAIELRDGHGGADGRPHRLGPLKVASHDSNRRIAATHSRHALCAAAGARPRAAAFGDRRQRSQRAHHRQMISEALFAADRRTGGRGDSRRLKRSPIVAEASCRLRPFRDRRADRIRRARRAALPDHRGEAGREPRGHLPEGCSGRAAGSRPFFDRARHDPAADGARRDGVTSPGSPKRRSGPSRRCASAPRVRRRRASPSPSSAAPGSVPVAAQLVGGAAARLVVGVARQPRLRRLPAELRSGEARATSDAEDYLATFRDLVEAPFRLLV